MSPRETRLDLNQELFRVVNERIAEVQKRWGVDEIEVVCECANTGCTRRVVVPLEQYRRVRKHKGWFIVVAGQPHPADETVIEQHGAYDIVASSRIGVNRGAGMSTRRPDAPNLSTWPA